MRGSRNAFPIRGAGVTDSAVDGGNNLRTRLLDWIGGKAGGGERFEEIALEVFRHQFETNPSYRNYCMSLGRVPETVEDWRGIPALPTDAFKITAHLPRSFAPRNSTRYFLTSGTTTDVRGRHEFEDLQLYEASILNGWKSLELPETRNPWFFSQRPEIADTSSLVWMFEVLRRESGSNVDRWLIEDSGEPHALPRESRNPVQLFSTAIGLLRWMESGQRWVLPEGSWIFETGGYKGLTETLEPEIFRARLAGFFGIPESRILNEYSMTELSSQFYRWPDEPAHRGPFWTRVRAIDPETGESAADGEIGYLEIVDLANLGSVAAIRTQDLAVVRGDSEFILLGRDPGALPRGCSRASDDLLTKR